MIPEISTDLDIIAKLADEPNDVGGLSAAELKAKFDEAGNAIKEYINGTLIPALRTEGVEVIVKYATNDLKYIRINSSTGLLQKSADGITWTNVTVQGTPGPAGPGPYEVAAEYGYTGTEAEFNTALAGMPDAINEIPVLTDSTNSDFHPADGYAATPAAVKAAYDRASSGITAAQNAQSTANTAQTKANAALPKAGGTMTGALVLTSGVHYGSTLPSSAVTGQVFFKKV